MRAHALVLVALVGCGDNLGGDDGPLPPGPNGWAIEVDMSALQRFVPPDATTWAVGGHARSALPLADMADVGGLSVVLDDGDFVNSDVAVTGGLQVVPVLVRDREGHQRQAHRSLLSAHFLPEGAVNDRIMALTLSDGLLASINAQIRQQTGSIDLGAQIEGQTVENAQCTIVMTSVTHGPLLVELVKRPGANLGVHVRLPNLLVQFDGTCTDPRAPVPVPIGINGKIGGTFDVTTQLTSKAPVAPEHCITGFDHTTPVVAISNWIYEINGDNPATTVLIRALAPKSEEVKAQVQVALRDGADEALTSGLSDVELLKQEQTFEIVEGKPITMGTCIAGFGPEAGKLVIRMAATVAGTTPSGAPGAPLLAPQAPAVVDNEFLLDTGLLSQLTFSMWKDGIFKVDQPAAFDLGLLGLLVPGLVDRFPNTQKADIRVDGELPAYIRAVPAGSPGDLRIELGDLMVYVSAEGEQIMKVGLHLVLDLDFVAVDGEMVPTVVGSLAEATVLDELLDADDDAIELALEAGIASGLGDLVGGGGVGIPEIIPGLGKLTDIRADADGRYLRVKFIPGATAATSLFRIR